MSLKNHFLEALANNEDDATMRLVYADWLDEQGEHDEADRQRKWRVAKDWLVQFCRDNNPSPEEDDPYECPISYEELMEFGRRAMDEGDDRGFWFSCGNNMTMCDALRSGSGEFWRNWSIVTGIPVPADVDGKSRFSCAC